MKRLIIGLAVSLAACGDNVDTSEGASCEASEGCSSGLCVTNYSDGQAVAGGVCTEQCEWGEGFTDTCSEGVCLRYTPTGEKYCYPDCLSDDDCRVKEGWTCRTFSLILGIQACVPPL